jgi:hypothetical protein
MECRRRPSQPNLFQPVLPAFAALPEPVKQQLREQLARLLVATWRPVPAPVVRSPSHAE